MTYMTLWLLFGGAALLIFGANALVRGASGLAAALGVPPLIIGLTVVAFGTGSPEVVVSLQAARAGQSALALGNVVGSNILNVLFILGVSALAAPLIVARPLIRLDVPVMIAVSIATLALAIDGTIVPFEGALLVAGFIAYSLLQVKRARRPKRHTSPEHITLPRRNGWVIDLVYVVGGLVVLVFGSRWLIAGAVQVAVALGVSELVIGLTIVAAGTSMPEIATSVAASLRGERDIAVGNVVGSNIFNLLAVLGASALIAPGGITVPEATMRFDLPVMIASALICLPVFVSGLVIARWEGAVLLAYYAAYTSFLVLDAAAHPALPAFRSIMLTIALPLTMITIVIAAVRSWPPRLKTIQNE
jgi:cation:H+ antiporter